MNAFHRATRASVPLKIGITGASGSGKTTAALRVTRGLVGPDARIAFCDTENGSASLYCDITPFDVMNMEPPYHTEKFIAAIDAAVAGGYKALVIDSVAHAWLQVLQDKEALDARGGNNWTNWAGFTKKWEALLAHIRNAPIHLVMCIRSKEKHEMNEAKKVDGSVGCCCGDTVVLVDGSGAVEADVTGCAGCCAVKGYAAALALQEDVAVGYYVAGGCCCGYAAT